jgi:hypothetical protein
VSERPDGSPGAAPGEVSPARVEIYERLMEAQERIARALYERGVENAVVQAALDSADESLSDDERRDDLFLSALGHYVGALGGRLEVRAVFGEETVVVPRPFEA